MLTVRLAGPSVSVDIRLLEGPIQPFEGEIAELLNISVGRN